MAELSEYCRAGQRNSCLDTAAAARSDGVSGISDYGSRDPRSTNRDTSRTDICRTNCGDRWYPVSSGNGSRVPCSNPGCLHVCCDNRTPPESPGSRKPVLGTWTGTKSISMLFVSANGQGTVTFRDDYTGHLSGEFHGAGMDEVFASDFIWTNNGGGSYTGSIGTESTGFTLAGETLTMTINPKKLGLNAMLDMDIPVEMHRV
ncbi:MAG: hypothetical protein LBL85_01860 [Methanocalculaceae archaeon]|jgi:hypothetical protein|nr:hypothetical protein [Methanocalculaceae archaeon]